MGTTAVIYRIMLVGHIGAAIVGFGGLITHGALHARAVQSAPGAAAPLLRAADAIARIADHGLYAVAGFGVVLVSLSDDVFGYGQTWIWASLLVWVAVVGLTHGMVRPGRRRLLDLAESLSLSSSGPGAATDDPPLGDNENAGPLLARLAAGEALTQLLMVMALALMVWRPGQ